MELYFPILLDGATGTELQKRGYGGGVSAEQWVLEHPDAIRDLHRQYFDAGSDIVLAPTFGANRVKLEEYGILNQVPEYNHRLAGLALDNAKGLGYVAADLTQTGKFLYPVGNVTFGEFVDIYTEQVRALEEAGVDLYIIETMTTIPETRAAVLAVKENSDKPVFVSMTCSENGRTVMGNDVAAALVIFQSMGVDAFGLNCSTGPDKMLEQIRRIRKYAEVPLIAKPNAGMPKSVDGQTVYDCTPEEMASYVEAFAAAGVGVFGSCCGSTPEHVRAIHEKMRNIEFIPPKPDYGDQIAVATEKDLYLLPPELHIGTVYSCDEHLEDAFDAYEEDEDALFFTLRIEQEEELSAFADYQYEIPGPLCILCDDRELLEKALRLYQGRAIYAGNLSEEELLPLANKYGLIV